MNVLFLHGVSTFGGSTKSLIELYAQLKQQGVQGTVICPKGQSEKALIQAGFKTIPALGLTQFDNTLYGHYRGLRWIILLRELLFFFPTVIALLKAKSKPWDLIHANEITLLPIALCTKKWLKCPLVVHVRSVQRGDAKDRRSKILFKLIKKHAELIAIDETVRASLPNGIPAKVIHNGINLSNNRSEPKGRLGLGPTMEHTTNPEQPQIPPEIPRVAIIGALLRLKGIYEFLEAARILVKERGVAVQFVVVGENARVSKGLLAWIYKKLKFSDDVMQYMQHFVAQHDLQHSIEIKGFVPDVRTLYTELDILCFPSYLNAAGRPVFEAALFGVPSIVALRDPKPDAIIHKETGLCIDYPDPKALAHAIEMLVIDPVKRIQLGLNAQTLAEQYYDIAKNAMLVMELYKSILK